MKHKIQALKYFLAIAALAIFVMPVLARAQTTGMQISPLTYDFSMEPGSSQSGKFNLRNLDSETMNYVLETELFSKISDQGAPSFEGTVRPEGVTTLADWITFSEPKEGTIDPNGQKDINFKIDVPLGAEPGGHYAAIFARQIKKDASGKTQLGVSSRVGLIILVSVPGDVKKGGEITSFTHPNFVWKGPVDFALRFKNTGSVHYESEAKVEIKPLIGKVRTASLGTHTVLPDNTRAYEGAWNNKYPFGYYKITAISTDGNGNQISTTGTLWALPLIIIIPVILLILLVWGIMLYVKQNFKFVHK